MAQQLPLKLLSVVCVLLVIALAGPAWEKEPSPFGEDHSDLVIVLDVSASMQEKDVAPSRLELAKYKLQDLLAKRGGGRTALVVYAGSAHIAMPLTLDTQVFTPLLDAISPNIMPREGKFLSKAIPLVEQLSRESLAMTVLVVSDAADKHDVTAFSDFAGRNSHHLLVWGMGNEEREAAIPFEPDSLMHWRRQTAVIFKPLRWITAMSIR